MKTDYLDEKSVTDLGRMIMALMSEVWILKDRTMLLEHLLSLRGATHKIRLQLRRLVASRSSWTY